MKIIYILWLRQLKRYYRSKTRIVGSMGQSLLFLVAFGFGFGAIYQEASGGDYLQFLAPGIIAMGVVFTAVFSGIEIIWDKQFGFLKETLVAPVSRYKIMIGRTLGGATVATIQGFIVLLISLVVGFRLENLYLFPLALFFIIIIALLFTALGTAIASTLKDMQGFQLIMNFVLMPIVFLSGAFFPLENLPKAFNFIITINPLSYGVDGLRGTLISTSHFGLHIDFLVLSVITAFLFGLGSYLFSRIQI